MSDVRPMKPFLTVFRYKTRPRYRKGSWKDEEKVFAARDLSEALRLAKTYAESKYRSEWVLDVCSELKSAEPGKLWEMNG